MEPVDGCTQLNCETANFLGNRYSSHSATLKRNAYSTLTQQYTTQLNATGELTQQKRNRRHVTLLNATRRHSTQLLRNFTPTQFTLRYLTLTQRYSILRNSHPFTRLHETRSVYIWLSSRACLEFTGCAAKKKGRSS